jgi:S-methylmethionine-dependent homocysteine/selenocysteine methylase
VTDAKPLDRMHQRIAAGEIVVMDGGTGTGLQALGVPMDGEAWGGVANLTHPEVVEQLHRLYLDAGAEIVIANTFATGPGPLQAAGYGERFAEANRNAVEAALRARAAAGRDEVMVAASMSRDVANGLAGSERPFFVIDDESLLREGYRRQAEVLAAAGAEVIALEMMGRKLHATLAIEAAVAVGLPVWLGVSVIEALPGRATTIDGEDLAALLRSVPLERLDAVFAMHSDIATVPDTLAVIRSVWDGPTGAYPHHGEWTPPNWVFRDITPQQFAASAVDWPAHGAAVVGGCCGIGPEHIAATAQAVRRRPPATDR